MSKTIFELSVTGANSFALPAAEVAEPELKENIPENLLRVVPLNLPDVSEGARRLLAHVGQGSPGVEDAPAVDAQAGQQHEDGDDADGEDGGGAALPGGGAGLWAGGAIARAVLHAVPVDISIPGTLCMSGCP